MEIIQSAGLSSHGAGPGMHDLPHAAQLNQTQREGRLRRPVSRVVNSTTGSSPNSTQRRLQPTTSQMNLEILNYEAFGDGHGLVCTLGLRDEAAWLQRIGRPSTKRQYHDTVSDVAF